MYTAASFVTNELLGPAIYFKFDIDPIRSIQRWTVPKLADLASRLLAVVGGVVATARLTAGLVEAGCSMLGL